jgi:hypothetical protein
VQAVKSKDHGNRRKVVALMQWLLKASEFRKSLGDSLAAIIGASQWDNRVKLGWCVVVRELVELGSLLYDVSPASSDRQRALSAFTLLYELCGLCASSCADCFQCKVSLFSALCQRI